MMHVRNKLNNVRKKSCPSFFQFAFLVWQFHQRCLISHVPSIADKLEILFKKTFEFGLPPSEYKFLNFDKKRLRPSYEDDLCRVLKKSIKQNWRKVQPAENIKSPPQKT